MRRVEQNAEEWQRAIQLATRIVPLTVDIRGDQLRRERSVIHREIIDALYEQQNFSSPGPRRAFVQFLRQSRDGSTTERNLVVAWPKDFPASEAPSRVAKFDTSEREMTQWERKVRSASNRYSTWVTGRLTSFVARQPGNAGNTTKAIEVLTNSKSIVAPLGPFDFIDAWIEDPDH